MFDSMTLRERIEHERVVAADLHEKKEQAEPNRILSVLCRMADEIVTRLETLEARVEKLEGKP